MYCDYCGAENQADAATCFACQRSLDGVQQASDEVVQRSPISSSMSGGLVGNRYTILARIGQGGFGSVYKAQDAHRADHLVAIKEIDMGGLKPNEIIEATDAFNREVQLLSELKHPNLPRMHTHFTDTHHWYLVMDFIPGDTLERYLEIVHGTGGASQGIKLADVLNVGMQLCTVLHYMHMHNPVVVFRDLKPSNIMLAPGQRVYLIDFGIARIFKPGQVKDTMAFGSPGYAAPEQYGKAQTTPRADIYSLGAILHQMLTGKDPSETPFQFAPVRFTNPVLPVEIDQLIMQMLEMDPNKRPASMAMVKQRLGTIADQKSAPGKSGAYFGVNITGSAYQGVSYATPGPGYVPPPSGKGGQSMYPPQAVPVGRRRISRRVVGGFIGSIILTAFIFSNLGRGNSDSQDTTSSASAMPTDEPFTPEIEGQFRQHTAAISALAWAPDSSAIASASADKTVQVWMPDHRNRAFPGLHMKFQRASTTVAWSPDGDNIVAGSLDKTVRIFNVVNARITAQAAFPAGVTATSWSPDGAYIAVGCADGKVYLCDAVTLRIKYTYKGHTGSIHAVTFGDIYIASASADYTVRVWSSKDGSLVYTYLGHSNAVNALAWSPDLFEIASASSDRTVQIWNPLNGQNSLTYTGHITNGTPTAEVDLDKMPPAQVYAVAWEPGAGGVHIASGGSNGILQIWRSDDGEMTTNYQASSQSIRSIAWTSDNQGRSLLVYGGDDHRARVLYV